MRAVDRSSYEAPSYARATEVPFSLMRLVGPDHSVAMAASHELWTRLCHDHVYVAPAAVPAPPFLLDVLDQAAADLVMEALAILLGFALRTNAYRCDDQPAWAKELREELRHDLPRMERCVGHPAQDADYFARRIIEDLARPEDYPRWEGLHGDRSGPCLSKRSEDHSPP